MRVKRIVIAFCISCFLCGCGQNASIQNGQTEEQITDNSTVESDGEGAPVELDGEEWEYVTYCGRMIKLSDLLPEDQTRYARADINGDGIKEIGFKTPDAVYILDTTRNEIIYRGTQYDDLIDSNGYHGVFHESGPFYKERFRFISINEKDECEIRISLSIDEDFKAAENNESPKLFYRINGDEYEYSEWKERASECLQIRKEKELWFGMASLKGVLSDEDCEEVRLQKKLESFETEEYIRVKKEVEEDNKFEEIPIEKEVIPNLMGWGYVKKEKGKLFNLGINRTPIGENSRMFVLEEAPEGMNVVYEYYSLARDRITLYDGAYILNAGSGGAAYSIETLYYVDEELKEVYHYETDLLIEYLASEWGYYKDLGEDCSLLDDLKEIGYSDWLELPFYHMRVGDKTLWWVYVTEDEDENLVYETIEKSDISDKITLCRTKEDFFETAKRLIKESGHDVDAIFSNKPIGNDGGSYIWGK